MQPSLVWLELDEWVATRFARNKVDMKDFPVKDGMIGLTPAQTKTHQKYWSDRTYAVLEWGDGKKETEVAFLGCECQEYDVWRCPRCKLEVCYCNSVECHDCGETVCERCHWYCTICGDITCGKCLVGEIACRECCLQRGRVSIIKFKRLK